MFYMCFMALFLAGYWIIYMFYPACACQPCVKAGVLFTAREGRVIMDHFVRYEPLRVPLGKSVILIMIDDLQ